MDSRPLIDVAAAIIEKPNGEFLLAQRPPGKVYAGYWEFPGGKLDAGESVASALARELHEELGIDVISSRPWLTLIYSYPHARVRLHFRRVSHWRGEPQSREAQQLAWQDPKHVHVSPMLPANAPILRALRLPSCYGITNAGELGVEVALSCLRQALSNGLRLVQVREKALAVDELRHFAARCVSQCHSFGAKVLINSDTALAREVGADGVHLPGVRLAGLEGRPEAQLCAASCHNKAELDRAAALGMDFVVLGPVKQTRSHPSAMPMGWVGFADFIEDYSLPVYALGGLTPAELPTAWQVGAQGIAMQRGVWAP
jgi:8-oxo-dGTP diphosphatase